MDTEEKIQVIEEDLNKRNVELDIYEFMMLPIEKKKEVLDNNPLPEDSTN